MKGKSSNRLKKKKLSSRTAKNGSDSDLFKYKKCSCPKDGWEVIIVDHDEYFNDRSTIYHHCDDCGEDFIIEDFYTGEILFSLENKRRRNKT